MAHPHGILWLLSLFVFPVLNHCLFVWLPALISAYVSPRQPQTLSLLLVWVPSQSSQPHSVHFIFLKKTLQSASAFSVNQDWLPNVTQIMDFMAPFTSLLCWTPVS